MKLEAAAITDVGQLRALNEDSFLVDERLQVYAVADGMGGHRAGEIASATALEALRAAIASGRTVTAAVSMANAAVREKASTDSELQGMGTTVTVAIATDIGVTIGQVGDSRAYLFRNGDITQITHDHSLVAQLVRDGQLTPEQASVHPQRSVITRALGTSADVDVDEYTVALAMSDRLLLCSDGLSTMVSESTMRDILSDHLDPETAAQTLIDAANAAGGDDNITAVVIEVLDGPKTPVAPLTRTPVSTARTPNAPSASAQRTHNRTANTSARDDRPRAARRLWPAMGRIALWALPILVVIAVAIGAVRWFAQREYFVQAEQQYVAVYQGVPDGLLGFEPKRVYITSLRVADLTEAQQQEVAKRKTFSSRLDIDRYITQVESDVVRRNTALLVPPATDALTATTTTTGVRAATSTTR